MINVSMWLKSFTSFLLFSVATSAIASEECECAAPKKTDHVFSHNHFVMMDYSLDSFREITKEKIDNRKPQFLFGTNIVYYTKQFSLFSDVLVGNSSSNVRPILDGTEQEQEVKQLGASIPFYIGESKNRFYFGKLALPTGFYDKQRLIPTVDNGTTLTDSFISNYYTQYIPPTSNGIMLDVQYSDFIFTYGKFIPEELTTNYSVNVGGLEPFIKFIPEGTTFPFFAGAADITINRNGTNKFPDKLVLPIATQRYIDYFSLVYDNSENFIAKVEYLWNKPTIYTQFSPVDTNDIIQSYNKETMKEDQRYYRFGMERRFFDTFYFRIENYLETASLYDGYIFRQRADAVGISKSYDRYTLHASVVKWYESVIGDDREYSVGASYLIANRLTARLNYRRMVGTTAEASFRAGATDPKFKLFYDTLEKMNPNMNGPNIKQFDLSGLELRLRYDF